MNNPWAEIACTVPGAMADDLAEFLVELSGNGVTVENRSVDTFSLDTIEEAPSLSVKAYLANDETLAANIGRINDYLRTNGPRFDGFVYVEPDIVLMGDEDWANDWKQHFHPMRIGSRIVIKPTWEAFAAGEDDLVIELDPGLAFGTGTHETTRLCLEVTQEIFSGDAPFTDRIFPSEVLDVGTGSGILSIAAAKCGARQVTAIDIDPRAATVTEENVALNGVGDRVTVSTTPLAAVTGTYGIVLANILAEELVRLSGELTARIAPGGYLILSGILAEREPFVVQGFASCPLQLVTTRRAAEWSCLCYRRTP
jgi:ribosomal protein L11 methyltransferase